MPKPAKFIDMRGQRFTIQPFGWDALADSQDDIVLVTERKGNFLTDKEVRAAILRIVTRSIQQTHTDVTEADVSKLLDMANAADTLRAVLAVNGFEDAVPEEQPQKGEAKADVSQT